MDTREVLNTLLHQERTGCRWELLPHDLLPKSTVWDYFVRWNTDGTLGRISDALRGKIRTAQGRDPTPEVGYIDSQSVKTIEMEGERGFDGGKKLVGRKRHVVVDSLGLLMAVIVTAAPRVLQQLDARRFPRLKRVRGDSKYHNHELKWWLGWTSKPFEVHSTHRPEGAKGFVQLAQRRVVERSIGWMGRNRRQSKDYEYYETSREAWIKLGAIGGMLRRLSPNFKWNLAPFKHPRPPKVQAASLPG